MCRQLVTVQEQLRRVTKERDDLNGREWPPEQPEESELERRAWEVFSQIPDVTIDESFYKARAWMYYRQQQRKAGAT